MFEKNICKYNVHTLHRSLILFCSKQHLSTAAPLQGQKDEGSDSKGINQEY